jgi:hypothetical protein
MSTQLNELLGTWKSDPQDEESLRSFGKVTLNFGSDGSLLYTVHQAEKDHVMRLTFRVDSGFIVTNQPSHPHSERTAYELTSDGKLVLTFGALRTWYTKVA